MQLRLLGLPWLLQCLWVLGDQVTSVLLRLVRVLKRRLLMLGRSGLQRLGGRRGRWGQRNGTRA